MYNNSTFEVVKSSNTASGTSKTFVIDHPIDDNKYLVHACLEGPEAGVYYRGSGEIVNDKCVTVELPNYVKHLALDLTVQITVLYDGKKLKYYNCTEIENNSFVVYGENGKFNWLVMGNRKNTKFNIEPLKKDINVKGDGPYKWI